MKRVKKIIGVCFFFLAGMIGVHLLGNEALAAENTASWRSVFDLVMRWLNFGIIVFILVKYAKTPIKNFLLSRREELAQEIRKIEEEKEKANAKIQEATRMLDESAVKFCGLKR